MGKEIKKRLYVLLEHFPRGSLTVRCCYARRRWSKGKAKEVDVGIMRRVKGRGGGWEVHRRSVVIGGVDAARCRWRLKDREGRGDFFWEADGVGRERSWTYREQREREKEG